jgi:hypothetical protein
MAQTERKQGFRRSHVANLVANSTIRIRQALNLEALGLQH